MQVKKYFQFLWLLSVLALAALSCKLVSGPIQQVGEIKNTAEAVATEFESIATEFDFGDISTQVEGIATDIDLGSLATELPDLTGEKPADIPVMQGGSDLVSTSGLVTYTTEKDFKSVVDFYLREMPNNGWQKIESESRQEEGSATLVYQKGGRKATIEIADAFISVLVSITLTGS